MQVNSKKYEAKKANNRAYGIRRKQREAEVFEHRLEAQRNDHRPTAA